MKEHDLRSFFEFENTYSKISCLESAIPFMAVRESLYDTLSSDYFPLHNSPNMVAMTPNIRKNEENKPYASKVQLRGNFHQENLQEFCDQENYTVESLFLLIL